MTEAATLPVSKKRGPNTPEGKARSAMSATKLGLRARDFVLLPEEDPEEWRRHVHDLMDGYRPIDAIEEKLVSAIGLRPIPRRDVSKADSAAAMWQEIRADRFEAELLTDIPPRHAGRSHGSDLQVPDHTASLTTAIRYSTAAGTATRRAQPAFLEHRKAKQQGLILPTRPSTRKPEPANDTNDLSRRTPHVSSSPKRTTDFTDPLATLDWTCSRRAANDPTQHILAYTSEPERRLNCTSEPDPK